MQQKYLLTILTLLTVYEAQGTVFGAVLLYSK